MTTINTPSSSTTHTQLEQTLSTFILRHHHHHHRPIALVTSGGTACDLEVNSVRYLDNFSTGKRGASSVEQFLKRGYAVIHLWRRGSASPYARVISEGIGLSGGNMGLDVDCLGSLLSDGEGNTIYEEDEKKSNNKNESGAFEQEEMFHHTNHNTNTPENDNSNAPLYNLSSKLSSSYPFRTAMQERKQTIEHGLLLTIPFRTVEQYLDLLKVCSVQCQPAGSTVVVYLAAAVSDFYIPPEEKALHKIQSGAEFQHHNHNSNDNNDKRNSSRMDEDGSLVLTLRPTPKLLSTLRHEWAPNAYVVSFKLETDLTILEQKAKSAIQKYGVHLVVANLLQTRNKTVWMVHNNNDDSDDNNDDGGGDMIEINRDATHSSSDGETTPLEDAIVTYVTEHHFTHISMGGPTLGGSTMMMQGNAARELQRDSLKQRNQQISNEILWNKIRDVVLNVGGSLVGMWLSYSISLMLRKRLNQ